MIKEVIAIDNLTDKSVTVTNKQVVTVDNIDYVVGRSSIKSYANSENGRNQLINDVNDPFCEAILLVWGDTPLIEEGED